VNVILGVKPARLAKYLAVIATVAMGFVLATTATATPSASLTATDTLALSSGGLLVTLKGSGFAHNDVVTIEYTDADSSIPMVAVTTTGTNGGFSGYVTLVQGSAPVVYSASDTHGNTASLTVTLGGGAGAPTVKSDCTDGAYLPLGFRNGGQCIASLESRSS
jgi:hypothetical protein